MEKRKYEYSKEPLAMPFSQTFSHGTKTDLKVGDFIEVAYNSNFNGRSGAATRSCQEEIALVDLSRFSGNERVTK